MSKKNKGFTLVELIVVIVILAILVGVTIGGIYSYVGKSRRNTDIHNAAVIEETLSTLAADEDIAGYISKWEISSNLPNNRLALGWWQDSVSCDLLNKNLISEEGEDFLGGSYSYTDSSGTKLQPAPIVSQNLDGSMSTDTTEPNFGALLIDKIVELLPDGLPESKTGEGFTITFTIKNSILGVDVKANCR